ncbi:hypothetical protein ACFYM7_35730 [Streptomyces cyaneofuscatus]|uniref:hypothetical protein n=1 Tax=Streptomyces cyaneofuscatus TaxID=66883 RepID=UPI0036CFD190
MGSWAIEWARAWRMWSIVRTRGEETFARWVMYWVNSGEVFQAAASAALSLGEPQRALTYFSAAATHHDPYDPEREPRGTAIYLARQAEAYLALGDLDGAVEAAQRSIDLLGGVTSARGSETLTSLRSKLTRHRAIPVVKSFLNETA